MDEELLAEIKRTALPLPRGSMNRAKLMRLIRRAERKVPPQTRAEIRLRELQQGINELLGGRQNRDVRTLADDLLEGISKGDWIEIRKLARRGKRIAIRFRDGRARTYFGVLFNTASTYLKLPGDGDQLAEAYALTLGPRLADTSNTIHL